MEKLVFEPVAFNTKREQPLVRIDSDAAKCVSDIVNMTGLSRCEVASAMIKYAYSNTEITSAKKRQTKPIKGITIIINEDDDDEDM